MEGIVDENVGEVQVELSKTKTKKCYVSSQRLVYNKPLRQLHQQFRKNNDVNFAVSLFYKYKPFYMRPPAEREKLSCLCKIYPNMPFLLKGKYLSQDRKTSSTQFRHKLFGAITSCRSS